MRHAVLLVLFAMGCDAGGESQAVGLAPQPPGSATAERWNAVVQGATAHNIIGGGGDFLYATADTAFVTQPIGGLSVGETLTSATVNIKGTGGMQQVIANLLRSDGDGGSTLLHTITVDDPPPAMGYYSLSWTPGADDVVASGKSYYWYFAIPLAGTQIGQSGYTVNLH